MPASGLPATRCAAGAPASSAWAARPPSRPSATIQDAFRAANAYADVAEMEIVPGQGPLRDTMLRSGMLVKTGYRTLGHMFVLREILKGAGVERFQLSMDQHLSTIAVLHVRLPGTGRGGRRPRVPGALR